MKQMVISLIALVTLFLCGTLAQDQELVPRLFYVTAEPPEQPRGKAVITLKWTFPIEISSFVIYFGVAGDNEPSDLEMHSVADLERLGNSSNYTKTIRRYLDPFIIHTARVAARIRNTGEKSNELQFTLNTTVTGFAISSKEVSLSVPRVAGMYSNISGCSIKWKNEDFPSIGMRTYAPSPTRQSDTIIENLEEGSTYNFTISCEASFSFTRAKIESPSVEVRTFADEPSGPPQNLTVLPAQKEIQISWNPPSLKDRNGVIIHYKITYNVVGKEQTAFNMIEVVKDHQEEFVKVFRDLKPEETYAFAVMAATVNGTGPPATINATTLPEDPTPSPNVTIPDNTSSPFQPWILIVIPAGIMLAVFTVLAIIICCVVIKMKRIAHETPSISMSQVEQQNLNNVYTTSHIYEDPENLMEEYNLKSQEPHNHTSVSLCKAEGPKPEGNYATLEPNQDGIHSESDESDSSICQSPGNNLPADYEQPWTGTNGCNWPYEYDANFTGQVQDYELPVIRNAHSQDSLC